MRLAPTGGNGVSRRRARAGLPGHVSPQQGDGRSPERDGRSPERDGRSPEHDGHPPERDGRSPERDGGGLSATARRRLTLLATSVAQGMILLDITIVNTALPAIEHGLQMTEGGLEWVISAYALSLAALIPFGGALGDRYGRKRLFLIGMVIFGLGSAACALSPSDSALIGARAIQGVGGAVMLALTLSILTDTYPREQLAGAIGVWAAIGGIGFGLGPVVGGVLLSMFGWSSVFWVNVPVAGACLVLSVAVISPAQGGERRPLDPLGVLCSAGGLLALTFGLIESSTRSWASALTFGPLAAGLALLGAFLAWEHRAAHPMLPPALLHARSFVTGTGVFMLVFLAQEGVLFYVTLLYQDVEGWSALHTGLTWLLMNVPFMFMSQFAGALHRRARPVTLVSVGCLVGGLGIAVISRASADSPFVFTAVGYVLLGLGYGTLTPAAANVAMRDVPAAVSGAASGVFNAGRQVGTSVGLAVIGAIGVGATASAWSAATRALPHSLRAQALNMHQLVASAQIGALTHALGASYRAAAVGAFVHGYQVAITVAAACVLLCVLLAFAGLHTARRRASAVQTR